jgi:hypothetical protein
LYAAAIGQNEIAPLGGVHAASTPKSHDQFDFRTPGDLDAFLNASSAWVFFNLVKAGDAHALAFQQTLHSGRVTGGDDTGVGDQQDFVGTKFGCQFAHALDRVNPKNHTCARLVIKSSRQGGINLVVHRSFDRLWAPRIQASSSERSIADQ